MSTQPTHSYSFVLAYCYTSLLLLVHQLSQAVACLTRRFINSKWPKSNSGVPLLPFPTTMSGEQACSIIDRKKNITGKEGRPGTSTTLISLWAILPLHSHLQNGLGLLAQTSEILISISCISLRSPLVSRVIIGRLREQGDHDMVLNACFSVVRAYDLGSVSI